MKMKYTNKFYSYLMADSIKDLLFFKKKNIHRLTGN